MQVETLYPAKVITYMLMKNEQLEHFGRNVRSHMKHRHLSTAALAKKAKVSPKTLNNILNGRHATQLDVLSRISAALEVELWQLWLPDFPADMAHDATFPRLVETACKLSPTALQSIARLADLELKESRRN